MHEVSIKWSTSEVIYKTTYNHYIFNIWENRTARELIMLLNKINSHTDKDYMLHHLGEAYTQKFLSPIEAFPIKFNEMAVPTEVKYDILTLNLEKLYNVIFYEVDKFTSDNYAKPRLIIIGDKIKEASIDGYLPEKRMLLDVEMPVKVLYIPKFPDVVVIGEDVIK